MGRRPKVRTTRFGRFLSEQRAQNNYSVSELALRAKVSASSITDLELGRRQLTSRMGRRLAGPLEIEPNTLLRAAGPAVEFDWKEALAPPDEAKPRELFLSPAERALVDAFVDFIRFHRNTAGIYPRLR